MPLAQAQAIRTIFFDVGYTLLRPSPSSAEVCQRVCQQLDLHIHLDALEQRMYEAEDYFLRQVQSNKPTWASEESIYAFWLTYYMNLLRPFVEEHEERRLYQLSHAIIEEFAQHTSWETYPDVVPTLDVLTEHGYTLGAISDWGITLGPILRNLGLVKYFTTLLVSATARQAKPASALYELALERTNSIADYTLHIGDSYILDVLGARTVGITPVLLDRPGLLEQRNVDCHLVHSLYELLYLLELPR